jgi:hypothetical protein
MTPTSFDEEGFLTTLGREFAAVVNERGNFDVSGHDCYSAVSDVISPPLRPESLQNLSQATLAALATSFNIFLETDSTTVSQMARAVAATLRHWASDDA